MTFIFMILPTPWSYCHSHNVHDVYMIYMAFFFVEWRFFCIIKKRKSSKSSMMVRLTSRTQSHKQADLDKTTVLHKRDQVSQLLFLWGEESGWTSYYQWTEPPCLCTLTKGCLSHWKWQTLQWQEIQSFVLIVSVLDEQFIQLVWTGDWR